MTSHRVLIALVGGPLDGRVIEADKSETEITMNDLTAFAKRVLVYQVKVNRTRDEIREADYLFVRYL